MDLFIFLSYNKMQIKEKACVFFVFLLFVFLYFQASLEMGVAIGHSSDR